ncbi:hypothetical protein Bhyg_07449 [Pseudolycoriella hygida]|uniref:Uncharacterized protein n=1 Tax=Pseudolycoriella hygida TaxID=35572 RepID=A0A9Q0N2L9_9DIPT|nr:hypothetical protein Bhyg_07449 [Pseudolycoriella hygida]
MTTPDMIHNLNLNQFSAKGFVMWILQEFLRDVNIHTWDFHFNASGDITSVTFWRNVCLKSVSLFKFGYNCSAFITFLQTEEFESQFPLNIEQRCTFLLGMIRAVGSLFDFVLNEQSNFVEWSYACRFLKSWQEKANSFSIKTFTALAGATLLEKFINIPDFLSKPHVIEIIVSCLRLDWSSSINMEKSQIKNEISVKVLHRYLDVIGQNPKFFANPLFIHTKNILTTAAAVSDWGILSKYMNLILSMQKSHAGQDEAMNIFIYCGDKAQTHHLTLLVASTVRLEVRKMSLDILANLLEFSRKNEMSVDCDWTCIFQQTLFSSKKEISEKSFKLFILEAERTDFNTPADELTIMEKALNVYLELQDTVKPTRFMKLFHKLENFETCEKLFKICIKHASTKPSLCACIASIIKVVAKSIRKKETYEILVSAVFHNVRSLEAYPSILHELIDVVDFSKLGNFAEELLLVRESVGNALMKCEDYTTTINLWETLKKLNLEHCEALKKFLENYEALPVLASCPNTAYDYKRVFILNMLAAVETFNIFERVEMNHLSKLYNFFQENFTYDDEALLVLVRVSVMKAYKISPLFEERDAENMNNLLKNLIARPENSTLQQLMLGIAFFEFHLSFNFIVDIPTYRTVFDWLALITSEYDDTLYMLRISHFRLLTRIWRGANTFLRECDRGCQGLLTNAYRCYDLADAKLIPYISEVIIGSLRILNFGMPFGIFAASVSQIVEYEKPASIVLRSIKKIFLLIERSEYSNRVSSIAYAVFEKNLEITNSSRMITINNVQSYLCSLMSAEDRERA